MATARPYFSKSGQQLQELFEAAGSNPSLLRALLRELKHRNTPSAYSLLRLVEDALVAAPAERARREVLQRGAEAIAGAPRTSRAGSSRTPTAPPKTVTVACVNCTTELKLPVQAPRSEYFCPTCKADFETVLRDGALQVVWTKVDGSGAPDSAMTDKAARALLGVALNAGFAEIKTSWRNACLQLSAEKAARSAGALEGGC